MKGYFDIRHCKGTEQLYHFPLQRKYFSFFLAAISTWKTLEVFMNFTSPIRQFNAVCYVVSKCSPKFVC